MNKNNDMKDAPPEYCVVDPKVLLPGYELPNKDLASGEKKEKPQGHRNPVLHYVKKGESLTGLALRYQVDKGYIRSLNRMSTDEVSSYQVLWIPTCLTENVKELTPEFLEVKRKERLIARFRCLTKCPDVAEARIYLEDKDFDLDQAVATYQADVDWERSHPIPSSSKKPPSNTMMKLFGIKTRK